MIDQSKIHNLKSESPAERAGASGSSHSVKNKRLNGVAVPIVCSV
jgi:hypothetical protein